LSSSEAARLQDSEIKAIAARGTRLIFGDVSHAASFEPRVWVICAKFNGGISARLCHGAFDALESVGIEIEHVNTVWVPGAFELPLAAKRAVTDGAAHAVVCLGAVIRGETAHFDFVASECAAGLQRVNLDMGVPVVFGVLTTDTIEQALERSEPGLGNKGYEAVMTALEMLDVFPQIASEPVKISEPVETLLD